MNSYPFLNNLEHQLGLFLQQNNLIKYKKIWRIITQIKIAMRLTWFMIVLSYWIPISFKNLSDLSSVKPLIQELADGMFCTDKKSIESKAVFIPSINNRMLFGIYVPTSGRRRINWNWFTILKAPCGEEKENALIPTETIIPADATIAVEALAAFTVALISVSIHWLFREFTS